MCYFCLSEAWCPHLQNGFNYIEHVLHRAVGKMEKEDRGFMYRLAAGVHAAVMISLMPLLFCSSLAEITSLPSVSYGH